MNYILQSKYINNHSKVISINQRFSVSNQHINTDCTYSILYVLKYLIFGFFANTIFLPHSKSPLFKYLTLLFARKVVYVEEGAISWQSGVFKPNIQDYLHWSKSKEFYTVVNKCIAYHPSSFDWDIHKEIAELSNLEVPAVIVDYIIILDGAVGYKIMDLPSYVEIIVTNMKGISLNEATVGIKFHHANSSHENQAIKEAIENTFRINLLVIVDRLENYLHPSVRGSVNFVGRTSSFLEYAKI